MPYYVHAKSAEVNTENDPAFLSREDASKAFDPREQKITFVASWSERFQWKQRERDKFADGEYVRVPWHEYDKYPDHHVHMSIKNPGLVAYTKNDEHGFLDRQTSLRPGRYLQEFYRGKFESISDETIDAWIADCTADCVSLKFAVTADEIETVYVNGPHSCMSDSPNDYDSSCHPVRVYGDSDLQLAYYGPADSASARGLVWPEKRVYGRLYGATEVLRKLLENAGYTKPYSHHAVFDGAKIQAIKSGTARYRSNNYVMPYIDGYDEIGLSSNGKNFVLGGSGYCCSNTNGLTAETEDRFTCESCGDRYSEDDYGGDGMCQSCYDDSRTPCARCEDHYSESDLTELENGQNYCRSCIRHMQIRCGVCADQFNPCDFSTETIQDRESNGIEDLCSDCAETHAYCSECADFYSLETVDPLQNVDRAEFAGEDTNVSGIRPIDLVIPETSYASHCSECNRVVRPAVIDLLVDGMQNVERERIELQAVQNVYDMVLYAKPSSQYYASRGYYCRMARVDDYLATANGPHWHRVTSEYLSLTSDDLAGYRKHVDACAGIFPLPVLMLKRRLNYYGDPTLAMYERYSCYRSSYYAPFSHATDGIEVYRNWQAENLQSVKTAIQNGADNLMAMANDLRAMADTVATMEPLTDIQF